jgi:hypothetical protein
MKLLSLSMGLLPIVAVAADTNALTLIPPYGELPPTFWEQHGLVMVSFPVLVYTGFALNFPESWWAAPLIACGVLKIAYDLTLWRAFQRFK